MDATRESTRGTAAASNRDGLLALLLAQTTLLTVVAASFGAPDGFVVLAYASALLVGLPAFVVGLALLAPSFD
ncbi:hypothetical protein [Halobacterium noricense]|uniref:hypothetical protein n=1 Tax=Halobacterium noricense TaxID=223182 RepID=UPI001E41E0F4|nr:hypothetical protein [Halobacterium noricense]UHH26517.1 hypothetical protein LT974_06155 [Halobacterium noricense]